MKFFEHTFYLSIACVGIGRIFLQAEQVHRFSNQGMGKGFVRWLLEEQRMGMEKHLQKKKEIAYLF